MNANLLASVKEHEGLRLKAYQDSEGVWTVGYGTNLQVLEIDETLAETWLLSKLDEAERIVASWDWVADLSEVRRAVIVEMVYNLGPEFGDGDKFKDWPMFVEQVRSGRYEAAANNMRSTLWASQVKRRAQRLAEQMETGRYWNETT